MGSCMSCFSAEPTTAADELQAEKSLSRGKRGKKGRFHSRFGADPAKGGLFCGISEDELHRVPGRLFLNGSSDAACLNTQQGRKGTNQDAMLVWENFFSREDTVLCGVFDGHGPFGHMVAKKVRDSLPLKVWSQWKAICNDNGYANQNGNLSGSANSEETSAIGVEEDWTEPHHGGGSENLPDIYQALRQSFLKAFKLMDKELKLHQTIDCFCSGSTAVTLIKQGQNLVIGNIGDSRAVLGRRDRDNSLNAVQLTVDLKPNLPREAARIQQCKGRVFALQDEPEVPRVWLPNSDSPGLAMARAFGDFCLKDYGLISVPVVSYHQITDRDEFIVLATDGVWDVLSNKEVVDIVASAPTRATAARALVDCAVRAWRLKFPTSKIDDCAVVCLFLNPSPSPDQYPMNTSPKHIEPPCVAGFSNGEIGDKHVDLEVVDIDIATVEGTIEDKLPERCQSARSLADCISTTEEEEWSALEGVTRVNSLVNLPRFLAGDPKLAGQRNR